MTADDVHLASRGDAVALGVSWRDGAGRGLWTLADWTPTTSWAARETRRDATRLFGCASLRFGDDDALYETGEGELRRLRCAGEDGLLGREGRPFAAEGRLSGGVPWGEHHLFVLTYWGEDCLSTAHRWIVVDAERRVRRRSSLFLFRDGLERVALARRGARLLVALLVDGHVTLHELDPSALKLSDS
jgi:hypothetical protein